MSSNDSVKYFFRQAFVVSGCCCLYFSVGIMYGAPTVFIPQLRKANITVTENMASWLSSTVSYAGVPWIVINLMLAQIVGRRKTTIFVSLANFIGFVIFYFSKSTIHLLIAETMFGPTQGAAIAINIVIISEYTSPKYRGTFLCLKSASVLWGIWVSNAIGTFTFWRYIPLLGFVVAMWTSLIYFWPESPQWLANKKRFAECRRAHRWLKGQNDAAELELEKLIQSQIQPDEIIYSFYNLRFFKHRGFYVPFLISLTAVMLYELSGKLVISIYAVDVLKKVIQNESSVYTGMLILDGVTVFSAYVGCIIVNIFKRRTILLTSTSIAIFFLLSLSLYLYLVKSTIFFENVYVSISLLSGFSISISCGPMILCGSLYGELVPYRYKNISMTFISIFCLIIHATFLKLSPLMFKSLSMPGTFLFFAFGSGFCTVMLYLYLPETKDKTLLEIEEYFKIKNTDEDSKLV